MKLNYVIIYVGDADSARYTITLANVFDSLSAGAHLTLSIIEVI
jgi:hypothetical protein